VTLGLTDEESRALPRSAERVIEADRYPFSPRIRPLRAILAKFGEMGRSHRRRHLRSAFRDERLEFSGAAGEVASFSIRQPAARAINFLAKIIKIAARADATLGSLVKCRMGGLRYVRRREIRHEGCMRTGRSHADRRSGQW
jgi:hypothetical protein